MAGVEWITSLDNPKVKAMRSLQERKHRDRTGLTVLEGVRLLEDALNAGVSFETVVYSPRLEETANGAELLRRLKTSASVIFGVTDAVFAHLAQTETPQGALACVKTPTTDIEAILGAGSPFLLAVDRVQDPGNLGTLVRTAAAVGVSGILLGVGTVELGSPKVLRSSMGAAFRVPIAVDVDLAKALPELRAHGVRVIAGHPTEGTEYFTTEMTPPVAVIVGNEANGLAPRLLEIVDTKVKIPMHNEVESLNVGVASALLLYECLRQAQGQVFPCH